MPEWYEDEDIYGPEARVRTKPRTFAERFYDNFIGSAVQTPLGAEGVVRFGTKHGNDKEKLRRAERRIIDRYNRRQEEDPAWGGRWYPKSQFEIAKGIVDFAGSLFGGADPTMAIAPGRTAATRIASQVGVNAAADAASQGIEIKRKVRDKYDPIRTGLAAGTGLVFQGGSEAIRAKTLGARVRRGTAQPGWKEVNDVIVRDLEGGGTIKNPKRSPKGAMGPQQVMPETARRPGFGINPWDGKTQEDLARVGRQYSAALMDKYDGDVAKVLAAYNAGPGRVDGLVKRYGEEWVEHLPGETKAYLSKGLKKLGLDPADGPAFFDKGKRMARMNIAQLNKTFDGDKADFDRAVSEARGAIQDLDDMYRGLNEQADQIGQDFDDMRSEANRMSEDIFRQAEDEAFANLPPGTRDKFDALRAMDSDNPLERLKGMEAYLAMGGEVHPKLQRQIREGWKDPNFRPGIGDGTGRFPDSFEDFVDYGDVTPEPAKFTQFDKIPNPLKGIISDAEWGDMPMAERAKYIGERDPGILTLRDIAPEPDVLRPRADLTPRDTPPPRPPFPDEPGFPKPGEPGNRGGPKGGSDDPDRMRKILASAEEALSQIEQVRQSGVNPLTPEALDRIIKDWRETHISTIKDKSIDKELKRDILATTNRLIDELTAMQDEMLAAPPKATEAPAPAPAKTRAEKAAEQKAGKATKQPKQPKKSIFDDEEGAPSEKKASIFDEEGPPPSQPPREPPPPRDEGGDGEGEGGREKYIGSINTERLGLDDDMYEALENTLADLNLDHMTFEEMKAKAAKLLTEKGVDDILTADPKLSQSVEHAIAARAILHNSLRKEVDLARQINDPSTYSDELVAQQNLQRVRTAAAADQANGLAGRAGQLLSSFRTNIGHSPSAAKIVQEMNKLNPARIDPRTYSQMLLDLLSNEEGRVKLAKDSMNVYMEDYIIQTRYAMMLSGLGTHVKNTVETMKVLGQTIAENLASVPLGAVRGGTDRVRALESAGRIYGLWRAALNADTYRNAGRSFIEGTPVNKVSKTEGGELLLPFPFNYPQRSLAAADSFWRGFIELSDIYGMSMRKAAGEGLSGRELWDRGEEIAQAAFERAGIYNQARADLAKGKISRKKFKEIEAENGEYHDIITHSEHHAEVIQMLSAPSALTRGFERFKTRKPNMTAGERAVRLGMNLLFPFARVSDRLVFHAIRRSPLAFLDNETVAAFKQGGAERDQALARIMIGTAVLGYYANQAYNGLRTGDGPKDPQKRNALIAGGWQPNSTFNPETGTYSDATAFSTTGIPAGAMATLIERYKAGEIGDEELWEEGFNLLKHSLSFFKDNTYLEGGGSAFNAVDNNPMADTAWANFWGGMGSSFVPAIVRQFNNAEDPVQRDTTGDRSFGDRVAGRVKASIPGLSNTLPEKSDVYGNPIKKDADIGTMIFGVGKERQAVTDPTMVELQRLERTQNNTLVTAPAKSWQQDGKQIKLNAEQFQQYQRESGKLFVEEMSYRMQDPEWDFMSDAEKKDVVKDALKDARKVVRDQLFPKEGEEGDKWWEGW